VSREGGRGEGGKEGLVVLPYVSLMVLSPFLLAAIVSTPPFVPPSLPPLQLGHVHAAQGNPSLSRGGQAASDA
jgi:hypothetical protein